MTAGLELISESAASRGWIGCRPRGQSGKDYIKAVQLRTANLPTAGMASNPRESQSCRAGCNKRETICHVLQSCPATHWPRIRRHNEIAKKIVTHCRKQNWQTEDEPHIRHPDGTLFKPDIIIHREEITVVADVQVCWEGETSLVAAHERKRAVYNNNKFIEDLKKTRPNLKTIKFAPFTIGARGIWPRCNDETSDLLALPKVLQNSCFHSVLKWGPSIHAEFGKTVWRCR